MSAWQTNTIVITKPQPVKTPTVVIDVFVLMVTTTQIEAVEFAEVGSIISF